MRITGTLRGECEDGKTCPRVLDTDDPDHVLVQGARVTDPALLDQARVPAHEALSRVPRTLLTGIEAPFMGPEQFSDWYDEHLTRNMLRLETLGYYDPDARGFARWKRGESQPDRGGEAAVVDPGA